MASVSHWSEVFVQPRRMIIALGGFALLLGACESPPEVDETCVTPDEMVEVAEGNFWLGCAPSDLECAEIEYPYHQVSLSSFAIDVTEVTVVAYRQCVEDGACSEPSTLESACNWGVEGRDHHPVNCVDWNQADTYCTWAGKRLPSEAEWEKAARGTDERIYPWGDTVPDCTHAEFGGPCTGGTVEVGCKSEGAAPSGALDMAGNVWEWTEDWYDQEYYEHSPTTDPHGPEEGYYRVMRGGSYSYAAEFLRTSNRTVRTPFSFDEELGFRCADSTP